MLSGGITGIAILLDYTANIPRWVTLVFLNIPVLIIGAKRVNVKFIVFQRNRNNMLLCYVFAAFCARFYS